MNTDRLEFIQGMIAKLRAFYMSSEPVLSLTDDVGQSITYDRKGAWEMLKELEQEERKILKPRRLVGGVDLRGAFG